jgi:hypothetical protein
MYRTLIAVAAFAAISFGTAGVSWAQQPESLDQYTRQPPPADVQGEPTGEEREGKDIQDQDRFWVIFSPLCWSRWVYVGNNVFGVPLYRRYLWCR